MEHPIWIVKNEFTLSTDSRVHYVYINYYSQIIDFTIHEIYLSISTNLMNSLNFKMKMEKTRLFVLIVSLRC